MIIARYGIKERQLEVTFSCCAVHFPGYSIVKSSTMGEDPEPAMDEGEGEERKSRSKCWMIVVAIVVVAILALCAIAIR
ncbi:hypothetical protein Y032_0230g2955 [Ancylostoma ceylanicum]|uniref:Uncharacterized protein n=1 Tax=Ancylostoma ceylanicum TaxID=53326 RepID=A0A016SG56_9BILA|nr:hypothetical protein Y032_0230g2955 [Ancylostoma ceylanicum]